MRNHPNGRFYIYLAGPVEDSDDPISWREKVIKEFGTYNFFNPLDQSLVSTLKMYEDENTRQEAIEYIESKIIQNDKRAVKLSDAVLINLKYSQDTSGTFHEQQIAWQMGKPIGIVIPEGEHPHDYLRRFTYHHADVFGESCNEVIRKLETWV